MTLCLKKIIKQPIIQPTPPEIIPNIDLKTEDFFIDDDDFDSFKKPELKLEIGQPNDENNDLVMISDDDKAEISKSLIKTEIDNKSKNNLQWIIKKNQKTIQKANNKTKPRRCS